jgi:hypothetical protein
MALGPYVAAVIMRQGENMLRRAAHLGGITQPWQALTQNELARRLFADRPPGSTESFISYFNIARSIITAARNAETMQQNPGMTILNLGIDPGLGGTPVAYEYRVVVVGRDADGNEVYSTLVSVDSATELNGNEVSQIAAAQFQQTQWNEQQYPDRASQAGMIVSIDTYIVSAGRRA